MSGLVLIIGMELTAEKRPISYGAWLMSPSQRKKALATHSGFVRPNGWQAPPTAAATPLSFMLDGIRHLGACATTCAAWDKAAMQEFSAWARQAAGQRESLLHVGCAAFSLDMPFKGDMEALAAAYWKKFEAGAFV